MRKALLLAATLIPAGAAATPLRCTWTERSACGPENGCRPVPAATWALLDVDGREYQRCDAKGCDAYSAVISRSGAYTLVDLPGRGMFAKLGDDGRATEVVSLGHGVLVSQGRCILAQGQ
jgi:hypothetical protein